MIKITANINELNKVVEAIKKIDKRIILLRGNLASGKTTLVKAFVKSLGIKENVTSPTFSIQQIYDDRVFHYDIYNKELKNFLALGLFEEFEKEGWHMVEWGSDELKAFLEGVGYNVVTINIEPNGNARTYRIIR